MRKLMLLLTFMTALFSAMPTVARADEGDPQVAEIQRNSRAMFEGMQRRFSQVARVNEIYDRGTTHVTEIKRLSDTTTRNCKAAWSDSDALAACATRMSLELSRLDDALRSFRGYIAWARNTATEASPSIGETYSEYLNRRLTRVNAIADKVQAWLVERRDAELKAHARYVDLRGQEMTLPSRERARNTEALLLAQRHLGEIQSAADAGEAQVRQALAAGRYLQAVAKQAGLVWFQRHLDGYAGALPSYVRAMPISIEIFARKGAALTAALARISAALAEAGPRRAAMARTHLQTTRALMTAAQLQAGDRALMERYLTEAESKIDDVGTVELLTEHVHAWLDGRF